MNPTLIDTKVQDSVKNVSECTNKRKLPDSPYYAWDIECIDYEGNYTEYPTQIAVSGDDFTFVSKDNEKSVRSLFEAMLSKKKATLITHNGFHFDIPVMKKWGYPETPQGHDTMYMAYFMDETQPRGLEALAVKYLGVPGWKEAFTAKLGSEEFYFYNARDTWYTMQLFKLFKKELSRDCRYYLLESLIYPTRRALDDMSLHGVYLHKDYIRTVKKDTSREIEEHKVDVLKDMANILNSTVVSDLNPNSTQQIADCLTNLGCVLPATEKGKLKTSVEVLQDLKHIPFAKKVLDYREQAKKMSVVKQYEKLADEGDGRAHNEYKMTSVETGRTSATKPNVQNLDRKLKGFFSAPKSKVLLSVDYNAIEFRIASWLAKEEGILKRFKDNPSWDPHKYFASIFYDIPEEKVTKDLRQIAKSANFSQLYCGTGFGMWEYAKKQGVELNLYLCERVHEKWHQTFPGFNRYYEERKREILSTGTVVCPTGFVRHFGDPDLIRSNYGQKFFGKLRQAVNVSVQNLSTHIAFFAIRRFQEMGYPMVLFIHDSISFELDDDYSLENKIKHIEKVMCEYPVRALKEEFDIELTVPLMVESEVKRLE